MCTINRQPAIHESMNKDSQSDREERIELAAYELLNEKGYQGCSMLSVARKAKASNETMYKWFGDKVGLVQWLVSRNANEITGLLQQFIESGNLDISTLRTVSSVLLKLLLSDRAIALNRAAASDPTGEVGISLALAGRETVAPLLMTVLKACQVKNELSFKSADEALELYLALLVGDLQIRRSIRSIPELSRRKINSRANSAVDSLELLLAYSRD